MRRSRHADAALLRRRAKHLRLEILGLHGQLKRIDDGKLIVMKSSLGELRKAVMLALEAEAPLVDLSKHLRARMST